MVSQVFLLGPYFINVFMNDIKEAVVSDFHLFANTGNIKLFDRLIAIEDCSVLQRSLDISATGAL